MGRVAVALWPHQPPQHSVAGALLAAQLLWATGYGYVQFTRGCWSDLFLHSGCCCPPRTATREWGRAPRCPRERL